jgi:hypothetical protein
MLAPVGKVGRVRHVALDIRIVARDPDQAVRMRACQRPQQHRVHHAEDGRVHADAEGQGQDDDRRETRITEQDAEAVTDVLEKLFEPNPAPDVAGVLFHAGDVSEFAERLVARLVRRHAALDIVARLPFDVVANVVVQTG